MCAIAGFVGFHDPLDTSLLAQRLLTSVAHRGPDAEGTFLDHGLWLGHRRLSIVDLTDAGAQPMKSDNGDLVITYNGEIYNHVELRAELELRGHRFRSHSDTEVILAAYAEWGGRCVERFNGMWAFAIWNRRMRQLFCSRDRFGVKPFYFSHTTRRFIFGSEIRQLLPFLPAVRARRDLVQDFILTGASDHTNGTFFSGIYKLPAAHNLILDVQTGKVTISRHYRLERRSEFTGMGAAAAVSAFHGLFDDAIRLRLRSDVPVGTCLSGGLDSSAVAAMAAPLYQAQAGQSFTAITAVSQQSDNNEEHYACQVVQMMKLDWLRVRPDFDSFKASLDAVVRAQEEPFGSTSISMQYAVMQQARAAGIPVLLDGQGGDETLMGYPKYVAAYLGARWRSDGLTGFMAALLAAGRNNTSWTPGRILMYLLGGRSAAARFRFYRWQHRYLRFGIPLPEHLRAFAGACSDDFELQRLEIERTNLPVLLRYEDKNSMAHSVETRLPFLDFRLVEMALSLPGAFKIKDGWSKWLLRESMTGRLPTEIIWRRNKLGFEAPERMWQGELGNQMRRAVLGSPLLLSLARSSRLGSMYAGLTLRAQWRLYSLARWEDTFSVQGWADEGEGVSAPTAWLERLQA